MIAGGHDLERPVAVEIAELHRHDPTRPGEPIVVGPLGLHRSLDDAIQPDPVAISQYHAGDLILGRDRDVHGEDGEAELADFPQRDGILGARIAPGLELAAQDARKKRSLLRLGGLTVTAG